MEYFERHQAKDGVILVHPIVRGMDESDLEEFILLAQAAGADILETFTLKRDKPEARLFIGSGKTDEIAQAVNVHEAGLVIFNAALSASQERNLERVLNCRVLDRTGLILDIFARRAVTFEGKLQVELAQLNHLASRLVRGWTHLERQGGGIGLRGPGETQLETDRRLLQVRVSQLEARLAKVKQTRQQGRSARQKSQTPTISLVGYTNAGKSTLFNYLTGEHVYAQDQLFATLDPTLRKVTWAGLGTCVLADTVGFVRNLPHELVEAFSATLEEVKEADLLLHVVDASSAYVHDEICAVNKTLEALGVSAPILLVFNKTDKMDASFWQEHAVYIAKDAPSRVFISAKTGAGMDMLFDAVATLLGGAMHTHTLTLSAQDGALVNALYEMGVVESIDFLNDGSQTLRVTLAQKQLLTLLGQHRIDPRIALGGAADRLLPSKEPWQTDT